MDFRRQYQSMNERIAPDDALVSDTLAHIVRGDKPQHRKRRAAAAIIAAAAVFGCGISAVALQAPAAWNAMYTAVQRFLSPVNQSCERDGVRLEVTDAYLQGHTACLVFTMQDIQGDRFSGPDFVLSSWSLDSMGLGSASCRLLSYDPQTRTAAFFAEFSNLDQRFDPQGVQTLTVSELYCGTGSTDTVPVSVSLADAPVDPLVQARTVSSGSTDETGVYPTQYDFLLPQQPLWQSTDGVFSLTAIGCRDGQLHLQLCTDASGVASASGLITLRGADGQPLAPAAGYSWIEGALCYQENIYDLSYDALADCTLSLDASVYQTAIHGDWRVTFRLKDE